MWDNAVSPSLLRNKLTHGDKRPHELGKGLFFIMIAKIFT